MKKRTIPLFSLLFGYANFVSFRRLSAAQIVSVTCRHIHMVKPYVASGP